jgi:hypothetical protein
LKIAFGITSLLELKPSMGGGRIACLLSVSFLTFVAIHCVATLKAALLEGCSVSKPAAERAAAVGALEACGASVLLSERVDRISAWSAWRTVLALMQDDDVVVQAVAVRIVSQTVAARKRTLNPKPVGSSVNQLGATGKTTAGKTVHGVVGANVCASRALELGYAVMCARWYTDPAILSELLAHAIHDDHVVQEGSGTNEDLHRDDLDAAGAAAGSNDEGEGGGRNRLFEMDAATTSSFAEPAVAASAAAALLQARVRRGTQDDDSDAGTVIANEWVRLQAINLPHALERFAAAAAHAEASNAAGMVAAAHASHARTELARAARTLLLLSERWGGAGATEPTIRPSVLEAASHARSTATLSLPDCAAEDLDQLL